MRVSQFGTPFAAVLKTRMGGESAPVEPEDSVAGLLEVMAALEPADNGRFLDFQGQTVPW